MCQRNNVQQPRSQQKIRNMFETLMFLEKQLEGQSVIQDADTVLADILEDVDFEITGIAADLLKIHQNSQQLQKHALLQPTQNHTPYRIFQPRMSTDMTQAAENSTVYSAEEL